MWLGSWKGVAMLLVAILPPGRESLVRKTLVEAERRS